MQPAMWKPSVALSQQEEQIVTKICKAKLFVFLRQHRHEVFDEAFQEELASITAQQNEGNRLWLRRCWLWRSFWKPTPACPMTR